MTLVIEKVNPKEISAALPALAELRIQVFRAFPYLYDGDLAYERGYLERFSSAQGAVIVLAKDGDVVVGAATGAPLTEVDPEFAAPFVAHGDNISSIFYCAESVLLPAYRGQGVGHRFFDLRETQAKAVAATRICFCSVIRPADHPKKPADYQPLDPFWRKRGYAPLNGLEAVFSWRDVGNATETAKNLQFWGRDLA